VDLCYSAPTPRLHYWKPNVATNWEPKYCDRFDGTSDMNTAIQRPGMDFGVSYSTVFRIHGTEKYKSIATQCQQTETILPRQRILLTVKRFWSN
jgi:hypothetical protein